VALLSTLAHIVIFSAVVLCSLNMSTVKHLTGASSCIIQCSCLNS